MHHRFVLALCVLLAVAPLVLGCPGGLSPDCPWRRLLPSVENPPEYSTTQLLLIGMRFRVEATHNVTVAKIRFFKHADDRHLSANFGLRRIVGSDIANSVDIIAASYNANSMTSGYNEVPFNSVQDIYLAPGDYIVYRTILAGTYHRLNDFGGADTTNGVSILSSAQATDDMTPVFSSSGGTNYLVDIVFSSSLVSTGGGTPPVGTTTGSSGNPVDSSGNPVDSSSSSDTIFDTAEDYFNRFIGMGMGAFVVVGVAVVVGLFVLVGSAYFALSMCRVMVSPMTGSKVHMKSPGTRLLPH